MTNALGPISAVLTAVGVFVALLANNIMRRAVRHAYQTWIRDEPLAQIVGVVKTTESEHVGQAFGHVSLPSSATVDQRLDWADERLETLRQRIETHEHPLLTQKTEELTAEQKETRERVDASFANRDNEMDRAEKLSYAAIALTLAGAIGQVVTAFAG